MVHVWLVIGRLPVLDEYPVEKERWPRKTTPFVSSFKLCSLALVVLIRFYGVVNTQQGNQEAGWLVGACLWSNQTTRLGTQKKPIAPFVLWLLGKLLCDCEEKSVVVT